MENYVYMTLLTNNTYIYGVILLNETLKQVNSKYPLVVLVTNDVAQITLDILDYLKIQWKLVENIKLKDNSKTQLRWHKNVFTKLQIFNQIEYDKIIYLDCDIMILKNIDHLFNKPHMSAVFNFQFYKEPIYIQYKNSLRKIDFNVPKNNLNNFNTGFLIIKPSKNIFNNIIYFINNSNISVPINGDEILLNLYFNNWPLKKDLHLNKLYNIFYSIKTSTETSEYILKEGYFIHFVGRKKPWNYSNRLFKQNEKIKELSLLFSLAIQIIEKAFFSIPSLLLIANFIKNYHE